MPISTKIKSIATPKTSRPTNANDWKTRKLFPYYASVGETVGPIVLTLELIRILISAYICSEYPILKPFTI